MGLRGRRFSPPRTLHPHNHPSTLQFCQYRPSFSEGILFMMEDSTGNIFVYSAGKAAEQHYIRTIQQGISLSQLEPYLPAHLIDHLHQTYPDGICFLWGDRGGDQGRMFWQQMRAGDLALCYQNRRIVAASSILGTYESHEAGLLAWPDASEEPYKLLFFLTPPVATNVLVESMPQYFGKVYQGLRRLRTSEQVIQDYGSFREFIRVALQGYVLDEVAGATDSTDDYRPSQFDRRFLVERQIRARRGQQQFRDSLRRRYSDRCVVTDCRILAILEAAHINPYRGDDDHHPQNGLLLRADIHTLFDLNLLGIEPEQLRVELHPDVTEEYGHLAGRTLLCPVEAQPSQTALVERYHLFRQRKETPAVPTSKPDPTGA